MQPVRRYVRNTQGTDFIIGDIQGCFTALEWLLEEICFSDKTDRLFTTGNLIGIGEENHLVAEFIGASWFHPVLGSNEYRFEEYWSSHPTDRSKMLRYAPWCEQLPTWQLADLAERFARLPAAIEIVTDNGLVGVLHGDCAGSSWKQFVATLQEDNNDKERCTSRATYRALYGRERYVKKDTSEIADIHQLYVGHSPVKRVTQMGNVVYMDTASVIGGSLSGVNLVDGSTHSVKTNVTA